MNEKLLQEYEALMLKQNKNPNKDSISLFKKIERANEVFYEMNQKALELEQNGNIDKAIEIYEEMISHSTDMPGPYQRLAILYRKQKRYQDEICVLERAVYVYENVVFVYRTDRITKLNKFKERLEKARQLFQESNESALIKNKESWRGTSGNRFLTNWSQCIKKLIGSKNQ